MLTVGNKIAFTSMYQTGYNLYNFIVCNGAKRGGVLSPLLFIIYIEILHDRLAKSGYGCLNTITVLLSSRSYTS